MSPPGGGFDRAAIKAARSSCNEMMENGLGVGGRWVRDGRGRAGGLPTPDFLTLFGSPGTPGEIISFVSANSCAGTPGQFSRFVSKKS